MSNIVIACHQLVKKYIDGSATISVLQDLNFDVEAGQMAAIVGASGSGKSTLLHLLGGLDKPTSGKVLVNNTDIMTLSENAKCEYRNRHLGFVYQFHHLLPEFSALENVGMPLLIRNEKISYIYDRAHDLLDQVGLSHRVNHRISQLSGGERQRVAIARALVTSPSCILADEPTGNLDTDNADRVLNLFINLQKTHQASVVMVTHDMKIAERADKIYQLRDGRLEKLSE